MAEATASRGYLQNKPSVSPREWAQTAAVGIALRNAGFALQFGAAGDIYDGPAVNELDEISWGGTDSPMPPTVETPAPAAPTPEPAETPLERALKLPCPICDAPGSRGRHLNINLKKNVFCCPKCGEFPGGIFGLHACYEGVFLG